MTPRETADAIEAAAWRMEQEQARMLSLAWHVAALMRSRRLPSLAHLLRPPSQVKDVPLEERRKEFEDMQAIVSRTWRRKPR
jgi:hypothetical protein